MTNKLTAARAKTVAYTDLIIHNEIDYITRQIISAGISGAYTVIISNGTTITESTPIVVVTGTVANPTIITNTTVSIAATTVTLGTTGTSLNAVIADINDANIAGVVASKNSANNLVVTYTTPTASWALAIGAGTANSALGLTAASTIATTPDSVNYFLTWSGINNNRKHAYNLSEIITHFQDLGFNITQKINAATTNTLEWQLYW